MTKKELARQLLIFLQEKTETPIEDTLEATGVVFSTIAVVYGLSKEDAMMMISNDYDEMEETSNLLRLNNE